MFVWGTGVSHVVFVALLFILACGMKHANTTHKLENWSKLRGKLMIKIEKFWRAGLKKFDICLRTHTKHIQGLSHPSVEDRACSFEVAALLCFPSEAARFATQNSCTLHTHEASLCHPGRHCEGICTCIQKVTGTSHFPFFIREYNQCHAIASCSRRAKWRRSEALLHQHLINTSMFSPAQLL